MPFYSSLTIKSGCLLAVRDIPVAELKHNVVALAKAVKVLGVPIIVTATSPEMWGPIIPELTEALPGISIMNRTTVNAFDEPRFAKAVEATGRKKLIIAGVSTEVCLALPAIHATGAGYNTYAVIDASGTFSETKRITGLLRMVQAGVTVADYSSVAVEMLKDNASPKAGALYGALDMSFAGLVAGHDYLPVLRFACERLTRILILCRGGGFPLFDCGLAFVSVPLVLHDGIFSEIQ